jgi:hypothetical protein
MTSNAPEEKLLPINVLAAEQGRFIVSLAK